jgi:hypothetical protein
MRSISSNYVPSHGEIGNSGGSGSEQLLVQRPKSPQGKPAEDLPVVARAAEAGEEPPPISESLAAADGEEPTLQSLLLAATTHEFMTLCL